MCILNTASNKEAKEKESIHSKTHRPIQQLFIQPHISNSVQLSTIHFPSKAHIKEPFAALQSYHLKPKKLLSQLPKMKVITKPSITIPNPPCKFFQIEALDSDDLELKDKVTPIISEDFFLRHHMKKYFKYGKCDKPSYMNNYFEDLIDKFYAKKENSINFVAEISLVPHLKCNLSLFSRKASMMQVYSLLESNSSNLLEPKVRLKLCKEKKLSQMIKDNAEITHLSNQESYDFSDSAYFNNKYINTQVAIASNCERQAVLNFPISFTKKYKPSKTKGFIKRLLNSQTGIQNLTLTYLLKLHVDLHQKSKVFSKKSLHEVRRIQRIAESRTTNSSK